MDTSQGVVVLDGSSMVPYASYVAQTTPAAPATPTATYPTTAVATYPTTAVATYPATTAATYPATTAATYPGYSSYPYGTYGGASSDYYPYLLPYSADPTPQVDPGMEGPTYDETEKKMKDKKKQNRDLLIAIAVMVILLLAAIIAIAVLAITGTNATSVISGTTTTSATTTTTTTAIPTSTTIGFQLVKSALTFGSDLSDSTTLAFISTQLDFCTLVKTTWYADDAKISTCSVSSFVSGSVKANMELVILNQGSTSDAVMTAAKAFLVPKSTTEATTDTILDASFKTVTATA